MEARHFDAIARAWGTTTGRANRRRLIATLPVLAAVGLVPVGRMVRAFDGGPEPATLPGIACTGAADCPTGQVCVNGACRLLGAGGEVLTPTAEATVTEPTPEPTPTNGVGSQIGATQPLPTGIFAGITGELGADAAFPLIEAGAGLADAGAFQGAATALPARFSSTVVDAPLTDLLATPFAIDIRVEAADPLTALASGDIGGQLLGQVGGSELAIGLSERNGSGWSGIAWLREETGRTIVHVFVAQGLGGGLVGELVVADVAPAVDPGVTVTGSTEEPVVAVVEAPAAPAPDAAAPESAGGIAQGDAIVTTAEVNLRAAPSTAAAVVAILAAESELTVTAPPTDGWLPVRDPITGRRGYVTQEFVTRIE